MSEEIAGGPPHLREKCQSGEGPRCAGHPRYWWKPQHGGVERDA